LSSFYHHIQEGTCWYGMVYHAVESTRLWWVFERGWSSA